MNDDLTIRLWGKAPGNNFLTPASFSSSLKNPELFIRCLNDLEHGWIVVIGASTDPNKLNKEQLIEMAREIIEHNGVKLLQIGQDRKGNKLWLSQNFSEYERRLSIDWTKIGTVDAKVSKTNKPTSTEKREALEALKAQIEQQPKTIPPAVKNIAERYNGKATIPKPLLTKIQEWYNVVLVDNVYQFSEKA